MIPQNSLGGILRTKTRQKQAFDPSALARMAMHRVRQLVWPLEI
jgi:hypothetical protein